MGGLEGYSNPGLGATGALDSPDPANSTNFYFTFSPISAAHDPAFA